VSSRIFAFVEWDAFARSVRRVAACCRRPRENSPVASELQALRELTAYTWLFAEAGWNTERNL